MGLSLPLSYLQVEQLGKKRKHVSVLVWSDWMVIQISSDHAKPPPTLSSKNASVTGPLTDNFKVLFSVASVFLLASGSRITQGSDLETGRQYRETLFPEFGDGPDLRTAFVLKLRQSLFLSADSVPLGGGIT